MTIQPCCDRLDLLSSVRIIEESVEEEEVEVEEEEVADLLAKERKAASSGVVEN